MPDTGFNHGANTHLTYNSGTDIDDIAIADNGTLTSDAVDLDNKQGRVYALKTIEDNTGATDGNVTVYVLSSDFDPDSEGYESAVDDTPSVAAVIDQAQNKTHRRAFSVLGSQFPKHKIHVLNEAGQEIALTVNYVDITIPAAS